jgi:hypothetical protein
MHCSTTTTANSLANLAFLFLVGTAHEMMGGAWVPNDMHRKIALESIVGALSYMG